MEGAREARDRGRQTGREDREKEERENKCLGECLSGQKNIDKGKRLTRLKAQTIGWASILLSVRLKAAQQRPNTF